MSNKSPIRKTEARAKERAYAQQQAERRDTITHVLPFIIAATIVLFIGIAVFVVTNQTVSGTPRLQVDQERIDLGKRFFNQPVRAVFNVKNVGDGTLTLEAPKIATLLQGC